MGIDLLSAAANQSEAVADAPALARILLVDDDAMMCDLLKHVLQASQFHVTTAACVSEAIHLIDTESFDALISDLHMPGAGDGFTVISAMRHKHPNAVTLLFTGYPALKEAMDAILLQADEILVKPMPPADLVEVRAGSGNSDRGLSGGSVRPQPKMAGMRRADEQTSASEPHSDFQGEGGFGRHQGRKDTFGVGAGV